MRFIRLVLAVSIVLFGFNSCSQKLNKETCELCPMKAGAKDDCKTCPLKSLKMQETSYSELDETQKKLLDSAELVMENSYNPYSKFHVGAALLTQTGEIIPGTNVENSAYGSTICAERAALLRANALGKRKLDAIAIIGKGKDFESKDVIAPCGACRQVIYEFSQLSNKDLQVIMSNTKKDKVVITTISKLLPMAFGPKDIGMDISAY